MIISGIIGGYISYILPTNSDNDGKPIRSIAKSIWLGIGATLLVPLFLEIAQSKLLDNIQLGLKSKIENCNCNLGTNDTATLDIAVIPDTSKTVKNDSLKVDSGKTKVVVSKKSNAKEISNCCVPLKSYFLFAAYCLLAAAAGLRFITNLIDSVIKDKQIAEAQKGKAKAEEEKEKAQEEKEKIEKENEKRVKNSQISQKIEDENLRNELTQEKISSFQSKNNAPNEKLSIPVLPVLPPVIHSDDPQKGRFGGKSENNERRLSAEVSGSSIPGFYNVKLIVESTNPVNPITSDVIFYIHDSFSPSVFTYKPDEFQNGKVIEDEIISYGAFTVGVMTDNGKTMLELDLSKDERFPKEFRER